VKKVLVVLILWSIPLPGMHRVLGQEIDDTVQLTEAVDRHGNVLVEENEIVAVKREVDAKYRIARIHHLPCATAQFIGVATFNPEVKSSYAAFAINFKTRVKKLAPAYPNNNS
jgi:hypothetical protein